MYGGVDDEREETSTWSEGRLTFFSKSSKNLSQRKAAGETENVPAESEDLILIRRRAQSATASRCRVHAHVSPHTHSTAIPIPVMGIKI